MEKIVKSIIYFYECGYLSKSDIALVKEDLERLCDMMLKIMSEGTNEAGNKIEMYLSFSLDSNCLLHNVNDKKIPQIWVYTESLISITDNPKFLRLHEIWLNAAFKRSFYISHSNLLQRNRIMKTTKEIIDSLDTKIGKEYVWSDLFLK